MDVAGSTACRTCRHAPAFRSALPSMLPSSASESESWKNLLRMALLASMVCALPALAGPDSVGLGSGRNGELTVNTVGLVVNVYAQVTAPLAPGDTTINFGGATGSIVAGDLVMVLQSTGIVPEPPSSGPSSIDLTNGPVGRWEFTRVVAVTGGRLVLTEPLLYSYAAGVTQLIRVPEYTHVTVNAARSISPLAWNGSVGGVVAFLATGTFTHNGLIDARGRGFRGGQPVDDPSGMLECTGLDEQVPMGAQKGEGIAFTRYGPTVSGRGRVANAGGGGVCLWAGGGGGGNGGMGGQGGNSELSADGNRAVGGQGGAGLSFTPLTHLMMGGGGGAGHSADVAGGAGGGIIFIRANQLEGAGSFFASGRASTTTFNAGSGGGAGGTLYLRVAGAATCSTLQATGGAGGSTSSMTIGPGGGGAGGVILFQKGGGTCTVTSSSVIGANSGVQMDPSAPGGVAYGAQAGSMGRTTTLSGGFRIPPSPAVVTPPANSLTSDATPLYTGTLSQPFPEGTQVILYVDGVEVTRVAPESSGSWSFTPSAALPDGTHSVYAIAITFDQKSLPSPIHLFTVDTTAPLAPTVTTPTQGSATNNPLPVYKGTAEAGSTVTVVVDGVEVGTTAASVSGAWSLTPAVALAEGPHTASARAADAAGNLSVGSQLQRFTLDTVAPAAPRVTRPPHGAITSNQPIYSGTAEAGSIVAVVVDGTVVGTTTVNAAGAWIFLQPELPADNHEVKTRATDPAGNTSEVSDAHTFMVDTLAPAAPQIVTPAHGSTITSNQPLYSGTAEAGSTVTLVVDGVGVGTTTANASGTWVFLQPPLAEGSHTVTSQASDGAGNSSESSGAHTFMVDTLVPAAPKLLTPVHGSAIPTRQPLYSGTAEAGSIVTVVMGKTTVGTANADDSGAWSFESSTPLVDGLYEVSAQAQDGAGNRSTSSDPAVFEVDTTTPPVPSITTPALGLKTRNRQQSYAGKAEPESLVVVLVDGVTVGAAKANDAGDWIVTPTTLLPDGDYTVEAYARDDAGNTGAHSEPQTLTVDTVSPPAPEVTTPRAPFHSRMPVIGGTAEPHSTVTVWLDGQAAQDMTAQETGAWSFTPASPLSPGPHEISVTAKDEAGNSHPSSTTYRFIIQQSHYGWSCATTPSLSAAWALGVLAWALRRRVRTPRCGRTVRRRVEPEEEPVQRYVQT